MNKKQLNKTSTNSFSKQNKIKHKQKTWTIRSRLTHTAVSIYAGQARVSHQRISWRGGEEPGKQRIQNPPEIIRLYSLYIYIHSRTLAVWSWRNWKKKKMERDGEGTVSSQTQRVNDGRSISPTRVRPGPDPFLVTCRLFSFITALAAILCIAVNVYSAVRSFKNGYDVSPSCHVFVLIYLFIVWIFM